MNSNAAPTSGSGQKVFSFFTLIQLVIVVALVIWGVQLKRDLGHAEEELVALQKRPSPVDALQKENHALKDRIEDLETQLLVAAARISAPAVPPAAAPAAAAPVANNPSAAIAALVNTPAMRTMMATIQKRSIETRYAELFTQLHFSPEQRSRFVELLAEQQAAVTDAGLKLASGNLSAAEQAALRLEMVQLTQASDPKIRELLGDDAKFAAYKQFNEQQNERSQVTRLQNSLTQGGQPLTADQTSALTNLMYTERKNFVFTPEPNDPAAIGTVPSADAVNRRLRRQQQLDEQVATRAASILNADQLSALRREQASRLEMMKTSTDMARQMLNGAPAAPR